MIILTKASSVNRAWQGLKARGDRFLPRHFGPKLAVEHGLGAAGAQILQMNGISDGTAAKGKNLRILYVDDDISLRRVTKIMLNKLGYEKVFLASSGAEALAQFENNNFDLVIVDLVMPGMDGYELISEIDKLKPGLPIVVASGRIDWTVAEKIKAMGRQKGRTALLDKPFNATSLKEVIQVLEG